jgi:hypothetical protein
VKYTPAHNSSDCVLKSKINLMRNHILLGNLGNMGAFEEALEKIHTSEHFATVACIVASLVATVFTAIVAKTVYEEKHTAAKMAALNKDVASLSTQLKFTTQV